jgi:hypothetical protein
VVVWNGELLTIDVNELIARHNELAAAMVARHPEPERFKLV